MAKCPVGLVLLLTPETTLSEKEEELVSSKDEMREGYCGSTYFSPVCTFYVFYGKWSNLLLILFERGRGRGKALSVKARTIFFFFFEIVIHSC